MGSFSRAGAGKVGEAGEQLKLKKMGDGGRSIGGADNLVKAGQVGMLTRLVWQSRKCWGANFFSQKFMAHYHNWYCWVLVWVPLVVFDLFIGMSALRTVPKIRCLSVFLPTKSFATLTLSILSNSSL